MWAHPKDPCILSKITVVKESWGYLSPFVQISCPTSYNVSGLMTAVTPLCHFLTLSEILRPRLLSSQSKCNLKWQELMRPNAIPKTNLKLAPNHGREHIVLFQSFFLKTFSACIRAPTERFIFTCCLFTDDVSPQLSASVAVCGSIELIISLCIPFLTFLTSNPCFKRNANCTEIVQCIGAVRHVGWKTPLRHVQCAS